VRGRHYWKIENNVSKGKGSEAREEDRKGGGDVLRRIYDWKER